MPKSSPPAVSPDGANRWRNTRVPVCGWTDVTRWLENTYRKCGCYIYRIVVFGRSSDGPGMRRWIGGPIVFCRWYKIWRRETESGRPCRSSSAARVSGPVVALEARDRVAGRRSDGHTRLVGGAISVCSLAHSGDLDRFLAAVCGYRNWVTPSVVMPSLMGVLLVFSFPFLEPGTTANTLTLLDLLLLVVAVGLLAGGGWYCGQWASNRKAQKREL